MDAPLLVSALFAGLVGGLHCAAMCGGFVAALAARDGVHPLLPARTLVARDLVYHAGRLASYATLGAAFGAMGAATLGAIDIVPVQRAMYVVANALLLVLAVGIAARAGGATWLSRAGALAYARVLPVVGSLARGRGPASRVALGVAWGFVPCGLVYGVLPLALFAGGAWQGALVMLVFGLATLPHLIGVGLVLSRVRQRLRGATFRGAAAAVIAAFALLGVYRALFVPDALAHGPFCLV